VELAKRSIGGLEILSGSLPRDHAAKEQSFGAPAARRGIAARFRHPLEAPGIVCINALSHESFKRT